MSDLTGKSDICQYEGMNSTEATETMANLAKSLIEDSRYDDETGRYTVPQGWTYLGCGAYRVVLLAPDGYVYKVQHDTDNNWQENLDEWEAYQLWAAKVLELSNGTIRLAKAVELFTDSNVIVMEYEPRAANVMWYGVGWRNRFCSPEVGKAIKAIAKETEITDFQGDNVYFNTKGEIVIVDYAC